MVHVTYRPSPQAWGSSPVCFSKAANTNLDTVSSSDSLLRDALSQSATEHTVRRAQRPRASRGPEGATFAHAVVLHVDPEAVGGFFRGTQRQVHQDAQVGPQRGVQGLLLLVPGQRRLHIPPRQRPTSRAAVLSRSTSHTQESAGWGSGAPEAGSEKSDAPGGGRAGALLQTYRVHPHDQ
ncbi:hypothetical protein EYF80_055955 [Liparis tanakae]|uniref:Uncharacterized protein n=1 Tax=Liparis tanakae TaxID=230148 RepID=A0A4Z2F066_9TELE|nr:hypothetical protein EYF80_055955 [Liparis tanakae]